MVDPARGGIVVDRAATLLEPSQGAHSCWLEQFKLHRASGLLLHDHRARPDAATADEITYSDRHHVTATKFAVDGEVEQRSVAKPVLAIEPKANGPRLLRLQARFAPTIRPAFQALRSRPAGSYCECPIFIVLLGRDGRAEIRSAWVRCRCRCRCRWPIAAWPLVGEPYGEVAIRLWAIQHLSKQSRHLGSVHSARDGFSVPSSSEVTRSAHHRP